MSTIARVQGREILDSRGNPTVEVDVELSSGHTGRMMVPSGASTGRFEAWELRDGDMNRYRGKGVSKAVAHVNSELAEAIVGQNAFDQELIDRMMISLDGTSNKSRLGANAILGISFAVARAAANAEEKPLYRYLANRYLTGGASLNIPLPMVNIISGGLHAGKKLDVQDFLAVPVGADTYPRALEMLSSVYWKTQEIINERGYVGWLLADEGGFGPSLQSNEEALELLVSAIERAGLRPGEDMAIALDIASSHFYDPGKDTYELQSEGRTLHAGDMIDVLERWCGLYPIVSIEDGLAEDDWNGWRELTLRLGGKLQLVGDDLFTTNPDRIRKGIDGKAANSVLVKMNQIGTLTETVEAVNLAKSAGFSTVISARSGETEDATLADLAVGLAGGQIKIGSLARSSRLSKYNQLLRIGEQLGGAYIGRAALRR
ncbi:phosphopyruvate hydratase [Cohnella nanjingensis]|uniref:Enolase n=1 Tax=Cohnella nanjingensis TaxID=1387779 RepID=A0A7X0VGE6_9BACL|nr:phosphopyruvate hydratase [Cohnella nanjingensis]MBB6673045.1 phosphopyruvate hydratase [Cohnella nanjingensis]